MAVNCEIERNFYNNRRKYATDGILFDDDQFEVKEQLSNVWFRPFELFKLPIFNIHSSDSVQSSAVKGRFTSDAFIFAVNILLENENVANYVIAQDQSFSVDYAGMFLFRFWRCGKAVAIVIDDKLPFDSSSQQLLLVTLASADNLWFTLLEKAYAKFLGGYSELEKVDIRCAMTDIVGCCVTTFPLNPINKLFLRKFDDIVNMGAIGLAQLTPSHSLEIPSIVRVKTMYAKKFKDKNEKCQWFLELLNHRSLDNISGNSHNDELNIYSECGESNNLGDGGNVESGISLNDFVRICDQLYICLIRFPGMFYTTRATGWSVQMITGSFTRCRLSESKDFPPLAIRVSVNKDDKGSTQGMCTVILSLMQSTSTADLAKIGLTVFELQGSEKWMKTFSKKLLSLTTPVLKTQLFARPELCVYLSLTTGQYLIIPEFEGIQTPNQMLYYFITFFSSVPIRILNGGLQKYGNEFLVPIQMGIYAPNQVIVGDAIKILVKMVEFPPKSRFTITVKISFGRSSVECPIKMRIEYIEVCQGLLDKELKMKVYYHEYIKHPLQSELFMVRCSAFIHELGTEVNCHQEIRTIIPKISMRIDSKMSTNQMCLLTAKLVNSLPLTLPSSSIEIMCSNNWGCPCSPIDVPPYSIFWYFCLLKLTKSGQQRVRAIFTSPLFNRSATAIITAVKSTSISAVLSMTDVEQKHVSETREPSFSCCSAHRAMNNVIAEYQANTLWFRIMDANKIMSTVIKESSDYTMYCTLAMPGDPISELDLPTGQTAEYND